MDSELTDNSDLLNEIETQILDSIKAKQYLIQEFAALIKIADVISQAFKKGNKVFFFGNGGSAADAQHLAAELAGKFYLDRDPLPAFALTANTSTITAIANDYDYEDIFSRQVKGFVNKSDVVIGISTSGNSANVLKGINEAKLKGAITVAFTGESGKLKDIADYVLAIPSRNTPRIQEAHILAGHLLCYLIEKSLFPNAASRRTK